MIHKFLQSSVLVPRDIFLLANGLLCCSCPEILISDEVWILFSGDGGSPGFGSIEQYMLHDGVKDPDFSAGELTTYIQNKKS